MAEKELKHYEETFERIWKIYPEKKGKGKIKTDRKKQLHKIGYDHMARAIGRYKTEVEQKRSTGFPLAFQYGSTFLTSGYEDYLDENYTPTANTPQSQPGHKATRTGFHLPESRGKDYTNEELEKILLKKKRPRSQEG